jgi:hypothetical protein
MTVKRVFSIDNQEGGNVMEVMAEVYCRCEAILFLPDHTNLVLRSSCLNVILFLVV